MEMTLPMSHHALFQDSVLQYLIGRHHFLCHYNKLPLRNSVTYSNHHLLSPMVQWKDKSHLGLLHMISPESVVIQGIIQDVPLVRLGSAEMAGPLSLHHLRASFHVFSLHGPSLRQLDFSRTTRF